VTTARGYVSAAAVNGKVYVAGGFDSTGLTARMEAYDPASNTWTAKAPMPSSRARTATVVVGGKIHFMGSIDSAVPIALNDQYDPTTDSWTVGTPMPTAKYGFALGEIAGKLYVAGGKTWWTTTVGNTLEYAPPASVMYIHTKN
jgi:N-acetylneuraminic acid mutarotase